MAWLAVDADKSEWIYDRKPTRQSFKDVWACDGEYDCMIELPAGSIARLIGRELTWEDEPVMIKDYERALCFV